MKRQLICLAIIGLGWALLAGCASEPRQSHAPAASAPKVAPAGAAQPQPVSPPAAPPPTNTVPVVVPARAEEGTSVSFDEIMAAVPVEGAHQVYQNLHVGIAATVNRRPGVTYNPSQVGWLLRKLEPRVSGATLQVVTDSGTISPRKVGALRDAVAVKIQEVVLQTLSSWEHAADYEVEVTVVSMYFTDSTVGRGGQARRGF